MSAMSDATLRRHRTTFTPAVASPAAPLTAVSRAEALLSSAARPAAPAAPALSSPEGGEAGSSMEVTGTFSWEDGECGSEDVRNEVGEDGYWRLEYLFANRAHSGKEVCFGADLSDAVGGWEIEAIEPDEWVAVEQAQPFVFSAVLPHGKGFRVKLVSTTPLEPGEERQGFKRFTQMLHTDHIEDDVVEACEGVQVVRRAVLVAGTFARYEYFASNARAGEVRVEIDFKGTPETMRLEVPAGSTADTEARLATTVVSAGADAFHLCSLHSLDGDFTVKTVIRASVLGKRERELAPGVVLLESSVAGPAGAQARTVLTLQTDANVDAQWIDLDLTASPGIRAADGLPLVRRIRAKPGQTTRAIEVEGPTDDVLQVSAEAVPDLRRLPVGDGIELVVAAREGYGRFSLSVERTGGAQGSFRILCELMGSNLAFEGGGSKLAAELPAGQAKKGVGNTKPVGEGGCRLEVRAVTEKLGRSGWAATAKEIAAKVPPAVAPLAHPPPSSADGPPPSTGCGAFKLDLAAPGYGTCMCGAPKNVH